MRISLSAPDITARERKYVNDVLCGFSLSLGPLLEKFEKEMAQYVGCPYAVAVNSGTSALHLIIRALKIGEGDEVITTPFSFIASANCILFERARPVFVDIDEDTLNIDVERIEGVITGKTKAILAVDVFGHPARWDRLSEIAEGFDLRLIEDSAEALGSEFKGRKAGSFADTGVFGFYPNKQITTGEGGMVVTGDGKLAELCRSMRNQGRSKEGGWYQHPRLGYNYRLSEVNCALGVAQLERIEEILGKRDKVARMYEERLREVEEIKLPYASPEVKLSWFVFVVRLRGDCPARVRRDFILAELRKKGIECRAYFPPIHLQSCYRRMFGYGEGDFPVTELTAATTIALPFHNHLGEEEIDYVVGCLKEAIRKRNQCSLG